jgi:hypothetical protein
MLWLYHLFALWVLAHMLWAAVLLEREWRRVRRIDGLADEQCPEKLHYFLASAEGPDSSSAKL